MVFPQLAALRDPALLALRLMVAAIFGESGRRHLSDPKGRASELGLSPGLTAFIGAAELAGALGVAFGVQAQAAALGLILIMLGAIQKKVFVWRTGFWGPHGTDGWHYDLMMIVMNFVIAATGGGRWTLGR